MHAPQLHSNVHSLPTASSEAIPNTAAQPSQQLPELDSLRLLQGHRELRIRHGNEIYRLRHTRNDKLILTK